MIYKIIVESEALSDLKAIHTYITAQDTKSKADKFILELKKAIETLASMPMRCRSSLYIDDETIRDLIHKKYTIVFQVKENTVHILTVFRQRAY
jgi:toxin ParE1/3/4